MGDLATWDDQRNANRASSGQGVRRQEKGEMVADGSWNECYRDPNALKVGKSEIVDIFLVGGRQDAGTAPRAAAAGQGAAFPLNGAWFVGHCQGARQFVRCAGLFDGPNPRMKPKKAGPGLIA
jgi:hypothetical protein